MSSIKKWERIKGKKHPKDEILLYYNNPVSFEDLGHMCRFFMMNEDKIYPIGYKLATITAICFLHCEIAYLQTIL